MDSYYRAEDANEFADTDTIGLIMKAHEQITREDSPIENVVLDLSNNEGGAADAAVFVLGWLPGEASIGVENTMTGAMSSAIYRADANRDRKFDEKDTVADKNIYCLISPYSFSCANLVPCALKDSNKATLLGKTSGGGSCMVQFASSAWGSSFRISSPKRLSFLKNGSFYDIDQGIDPDYYINDIANFYDREALTQFINGLF
jgi:C-terminal processing protease CtpA/Prc